MNIEHTSVSWLPVIFSLIIANPAHSHEYWLDPIDTSVKNGSAAIVEIRNGENYAGASFPYNSESFTSVTFSNAGKITSYTGRLGDYPAIHMQLDQNGLHAVTVNSTDTVLQYKSWQQFSTFLDYHGLDSIRQQHTARNLPLVGVTEQYRRNAKTLIQVTHNGEPETHRDTNTSISSIDDNAAFKASGSDFEIILLNNPYQYTDEIRLQLLFEGKPLADRQTELFWRGAQLLRLTQKTDTNGIAQFRLYGDGDYMLNAVHVIDPPAKDTIHWHSRWASLTFERRGFGKQEHNNNN